MKTKLLITLIVTCILTLVTMVVFATSGGIDGVGGSTYHVTGAWRAFSSTSASRSAMSVIERVWAEGRIKDFSQLSCASPSQCNYVGDTYIADLYYGAYWTTQHSHTNFGTGSTYAFYTASGNNAANYSCWSSWSTSCYG
jgi:hypothetical protein